MFWKQKEKENEEPDIAIVSTCGGFAVRKKDRLQGYKYLEAAKNKSEWWSASFKAELCIFESAEKAKEGYFFKLDEVVEYL